MSERQDDTEEDEEEDELPSQIELLLEAALYRDYALDGNYLYVKRFFEGPDLQFDAHCVYCEQSSTFKQAVGNRGTGSGRQRPSDQSWLEPKVFTIKLQCQRKPKHLYYYVFRIERQAIAKIGQSPSLADIASADIARFRKVLGDPYRADLHRAVGLYAHGIGAGSFVYLRRIFEHLLAEAAKTERKAGNPLEGFEIGPMDEKVKALAGTLPPEVVETSGTYAVLSAGIHALTEEQCLTLFPVMRAAVMLILDGHLAALERDKNRKDLKRALAKAQSEIKGAAKGRSEKPAQA